MKTVKELRQMGYTVKVRHNRCKVNMPSLDNGKTHLLSKGGLTEVNIYKGDILLTSGLAKCSKHDNYNRKRGVQIALGRAIKYSDLI